MSVFRNLLINKKRKPYYCEVEYLESTGQQTNATDTANASWIDTGIVPNNTTQMECRVSFTTLVSGNNTEALFGATGASTGNFRFAFGFASISPYTNFYFGLGGQNVTTSITRDTNVHTFKIDAINKTWAIDDTSGSFTSSGSLSGTSSIFLFARHNPYYGDNKANKPANAKTYYCKIWQGGSLVRDMIPVLDWNMTPCMYDKVSGRLFYNQGTGTFTYGREIHQVDYIQTIYNADGNSFIDTGYYPNFNTKVEFMASGISADTFVGSSSGTWFTGGRQAYLQKMFGSYYNPSNQRLYFGFSTSLNDASFSTANMYGDNKKFVLDKTGLYINDTKIVNNTNTTDFTSPATLAIFGLNNNGTIISPTGMKLQYYKIWDNNVLSRDFIPAIDENGVGFMFDRVTHTIFDNVGTGVFKYPAREVEYLESTGTQHIDTGIVGDLSTEINCEAAIVEAGNASVTNIMGNNVTSSRAITINMSANVTNPSPSRIRFGNKDNTTIAGAINLNTFYKYTTNKDNLTVQDIEGTILNTYAFNATTAFTTNGNILIYKLGDTSTQYIGKIKVSSASIKNSGVLVRYFIPVFKDGIAGMLDKQNNVFYGNAGSGDFTVGKIVESEWE